jgi:hypothetical protein
MGFGKVNGITAGGQSVLQPLVSDPEKTSPVDRKLAGLINYNMRNRSLHPEPLQGHNTKQPRQKLMMASADDRGELLCVVESFLSSFRFRRTSFPPCRMRLSSGLLRIRSRKEVQLSTSPLLGCLHWVASASASASDPPSSPPSSSFKTT